MRGPATIGHRRGRSSSARATAISLLALAAAACQDRVSDEPTVEGDAGPRRVVALAPSLAEVVADLGAASGLVGVSSFGAAPAGADGVARVGGFTDPSIERIIALRPDLVLGVPLQRGALESCRAARLRTLEVPCQTVSEALEAYRTLGEALGLAREAEEARAELASRLDRVRRAVSGRARPRTLFLLGLAGEDLQLVFPVPPGNFADELLVLAGGDNVLEAAAATISAETVVTLAPEVVLEVAMDAAGDVEERVLSPSPLWTRLGSVPAVREGRVHALAASSLLVPGPRMGAGAELLARLLHGEPDDAAP